MSDALIAVGTVIKRGNGATPEVFTNVGEVTDIDPPGGAAAEIKVTHLTSTAEEFKLGLRDEGTVTLTVNLVAADAQQTGLRSDRDAKTLRNFKIVLSNGTTTLFFAAYVQQFKVQSLVVDGAIRATVSLRVSGAVTWS